MKNEIFTILNEWYQIIKKYPYELEMTEENFSDFVYDSSYFMDKYMGTEYQKFAHDIGHAWLNFKEKQKEARTARKG